MAERNQFNWTRNMRIFLYETLVSKFGPFSEWESVAYPSKDRKNEYHEVLKVLSRSFSIQQNLDIQNGDKWEAVENQVRWATTNQKRISGVLNYILNAAAAYESGFITSKNVPDYLDPPKFLDN